MDELKQEQLEYSVAYVDSRGRISRDGVEFIRKSGEHRTSFIARYLTAQGKEGWSLSGIQHLGRPETAYYVMHRPLAEGASAAAEQTPDD
ncbi:MAG: hypothetical protein WD800_06535 [Dehalococcoidia bacterium]